MKPITFEFYVEALPEYSAGLRGFTDEVRITIDSGNPGGAPGEFVEALRQFLSEWYDCSVETMEQARKRIAAIEAAMGDGEND